MFQMVLLSKFLTMSYSQSRTYFNARIALNFDPIQLKLSLMHQKLNETYVDMWKDGLLNLTPLYPFISLLQLSNQQH